MYSLERFMTLLGRGTRHVIVTDDDDVLFVVKFGARELHEIRVVVEHGRVDLKRLTPHTVLDAIRRSFAADERDPVPPRKQCYLAAKSFYDLRDMGLPIDELDFLNADELNTKVPSKPARSSIYSGYNWRFY